MLTFKKYFEIFVHVLLYLLKSHLFYDKYCLRKGLTQKEVFWIFLFVKAFEFQKVTS